MTVDELMFIGTIDEYIASLPPDEQALVAFYGEQIDREIAAWKQRKADRKRIRAAKRRARVITRAKAAKGSR